MSLTLYITLTVVALSLFIGANIYIPKRLCTLFGVKKTKVFIFIFSLITILGAWGIMGALARVDNLILLNLFRFTVTWLGLVFYLLLFLVCFEILQRSIRINKKYAGISIIALSILAVIYGIWNARDYKVYQVDIPIDNLSKEVRIFHIPDLHLGPFRGKGTLQNIITDIEQLKPDFIFLNGDFVDGQGGLGPETLDLLKQVKHPMYFTSGNHDSYVDIREVKTLLTQYGVRVLDNEVINTHGIQIIGLDYMNADDEVFDAHASTRKETIKSVLPNLKINHEIPVVIVHHSPVGIEHMNKAGADLVLTGHTHAGQFFPATLFAKIQFKFLKGLYKYKDTILYVNQGIGTFGPPMRIGTKGEATLVRLVSSNIKGE